MNDEKLELLAVRWIAFHKKMASGEIDTELEDAWEELDALCASSPALALQTIIRILSIDSSDTILGNIAAGPLEDLLAKNGDAVIDSIESAADSFPMLKVALTGVWRNTITSDVWERVQALSEHAKQGTSRDGGSRAF